MESVLLKRIERLRRKLNTFGRDRDLLDPQVVRISQQLDGLLNQYHKMNRYQQMSLW